MSKLESLPNVDWLGQYGIECSNDAAALGEPATLTVILRDLDTDCRTHAIIPVSCCEPGDDQREVIIRAMAGRFPDARSKTYNPEKQVASFVGSRHLYIVIYEEHETARVPERQPPLFAIS